MKCKTLAIPLRTVEYSNTSQIVSLFTRAHGVVEAIAKGVHRPRNPFDGPFDLAVLREVVYVERRPPALSILAESKLLEPWRGLRKALPRYLGASYVLELLRGVGTGGEAAADLFDLARSTLRSVSEGPLETLGPVLVHFQVRLLHLLGFLAPPEACVICRRPWPGMPHGAYFSARAGGIVCRRCREKAEAGTHDRPLPGRGVSILGEFTRRRELDPAPVLDPVVLRRLQAALARSCTALLERPLRVVRYAPVWS